MKHKYLLHGMGLSNISASKLLDDKHIEYVIVDKNNQEDNKILSSLSSFSEIIKAPGIPWDTSILIKAKELNIPVITELNLGLSYISKNTTLIGVTGTNGKSSYVKYLNDYLTFLGKSSKIAGNYGIPICDIVLESQREADIEHKLDFLIIELSSFQTEIKESLNLDMAICLNISPSHMERYLNFNSYREAKLNIINHLKSDAPYISFDEYIPTEFKKSYNAVRKIESFPSSFYLNGNAAIDTYSILLSCLSSLKIDTSKLVEFDSFFKKLPFRQEVIIDNSELLVINDSKSTNWDSTLALLSSQLNKEKSINIIIGGKVRNINDCDIPEKLLKLFIEKNINIFLIGESSQILSEILLENKINFYSDNLENICKKLYSENGIILFSPGFPSFDLFENYVARGNYFNELWKNI